MEDKTVLTPWEITGSINYEELKDRFGVSDLTEELLSRLEDRAGYRHFMLKRGIFYSHRDIGAVLDHHEKGGNFVLYTGRGPSGPVHLGHLVPWLFTKHLQDIFGCKLLFQFTDDEKMLIREGFNSEKADHWVYENALDLMALGFDPEKTEFIVNTRHTSKLFTLALKIAKRTTASTMRSVFGFDDQTNIGAMFFPSMQAAPCFLESERTREPVPCLIPAGIDQDPYWRLTRDIAQKMGYPKPAQIHGRMLPGLMCKGKMSSSRPETAIYMTDVPKLVEWKLKSVSPPEDRTLCPLTSLCYFLLLEQDEELKEFQLDCMLVNITCEECKAKIATRVNRLLRKHQRRRQLMGSSVAKMLE